MKYHKGGGVSHGPVHPQVQLLKPQTHMCEEDKERGLI